MQKKWKHKNIKESFYGAFLGLGKVLKAERNARIIFFLGAVIFLLAILLSFTLNEFMILTIIIAIVFACEVFNTLIEQILDIVKPQTDPHIKILKDISSAAVLIVCLAALISGSLLFLPKIINLLK